MDVQVRGGAFKRTGAMFEYLGAFVAPKLSMAAQEEIGRIILDRALQLVPVRTGSLRASGRVVKSQDRKSIEVRFGTSRVRYAQVVEYGRMSFAPFPPKPYLRPAVRYAMRRSGPAVSARLTKVLKDNTPRVIR
jgi:hypothetical protein